MMTLRIERERGYIKWLSFIIWKKKWNTPFLIDQLTDSLIVMKYFSHKNNFRSRTQMLHFDKGHGSYSSPSDFADLEG